MKRYQVSTLAVVGLTMLLSLSVASTAFAQDAPGPTSLPGGLIV
jgi:hypothetical protein